MTIRKSNGVVASDVWDLILPSQQELVDESNQAYSSAVSRQRSLSKGEERVRQEGNKQLEVQRLESLKAYNAVQENAKVHELARVSFYTLATHHLEQVQEVAGTKIEKPVEEYAKHNLNTLARQQGKLSEVYNQKLIEIQVRDVYVNDEPEVVVVEKERPPRGVLEWLIGGRE